MMIDKFPYIETPCILYCQKRKKNGLMTPNTSEIEQIKVSKSARALALLPRG
jgi:hypothetical protein